MLAKTILQARTYNAFIHYRDMHNSPTWKLRIPCQLAKTPDPALKLLLKHVTQNNTFFNRSHVLLVKNTYLLIARKIRVELNSRKMSFSAFK